MANNHEGKTVVDIINGVIQTRGEGDLQTIYAEIRQRLKMKDPCAQEVCPWYKGEESGIQINCRAPGYKSCIPRWGHWGATKLLWIVDSPERLLRTLRREIHQDLIERTEFLFEVGGITEMTVVDSNFEVKPFNEREERFADSVLSLTRSIYENVVQETRERIPLNRGADFKELR